jgi:hypothetical protein
MGSWGNGNLECDGVQDKLAGVCDDLFSRVIELLQHPRAHEYDDEEIDELFAKIEMIFALSDRGMVNSSPDPEALKLLFDPYVQRWADYHRRAGHDVPVERQAIIEQSFSHLAAIAERASEGSFIHRVGLISEIMSNQKPPRAPEI